MNYKSIRIYEDTFIGLDTLANRYGTSKTELLEAMKNYFLTTGINPFEPTDVTTEVKKLKNQLISFIRTQEKEKLNPMIKKVDVIVQSVANHIEMNDKPIEKTKTLITKLASFINEKHTAELSKSEEQYQDLNKKLEDINTQLQAILSKNKKGIFG